VEEDCVPVLEKVSSLKAGSDFTVGYSPERVNPGDKAHRFENITKVVSGQDARTLDIIADVYGSVVTAGIHRAPSIKVAEAAKVIENTQRDLNIALMNELSLIFHRLGIDTKSVLEAAGTKWNFLKFSPGLVGGHCIGVDPYYLTAKAESVGYHPQVILSGRRINNGMGKFVAEQTMKLLSQLSRPVNDLKVGVLGLTFKENVPDIRNSKIHETIKYLQDFGVHAVRFTILRDGLQDLNAAVPIAVITGQEAENAISERKASGNVIVDGGDHACVDIVGLNFHQTFVRLAGVGGIVQGIHPGLANQKIVIGA